MRAYTEPWHWCVRGVQNNTKFVFQVAAGTSCRHQIAEGTGERALHPVEWLASRLAE